MGMTIDEALGYMPCLMEACSHCLVKGCDKPIEKIDEAKLMVINTMRKYQMIEQIVSDFREYQKGISCGFGGATYMQMVSEVVEDGEIH